MNKRQIIYIALILVLLIVFGISAFYVATYFLESREQKEQFDELANLVASIQSQTSVPTEATDPAASDPTEGDTDPSSSSEPTEPTEETEPVMLPEYAALYELNSDIVGWIKIEDTKINYPVMQTPDYTDFYLKKNFNKNYSSQGCIYVREECDVNKPSDNLTIYGHHMNDGSMFAALDRYMYQSNWEKNSLITFDTLYEHHTYQIFAVFKTTATVGKGFSYHLFVDAENEEEFNEFVATCKELALYDTGITPLYGDKLICLSTCEYSQTNGRLVVVAVLVD